MKEAPATENEKVIRVSADHPLDLFIDPSERPRSLVLICDAKPRTVEPTAVISVESNKRKDGRWALLFELQSDNFVELFHHFCTDVIDSSSGIANTAKGSDFVITRFNEWKKLFQKPSKRLQRNEIQGLAGEMLFLKNILIPRYGEEDALRSWMNAKQGKQDFICPDRWYEVKTVKKGRHVVNITSLDQLDRDDDGVLGLVTLTDTSSNAAEGFSINGLYDSIISRLESEFNKKLFAEILALAGYEKDPEFDEPVFELAGIEEFGVRGDFPRLRRSKTAPAIADAEYDVLIDSLELFRQ